MTTLSPELIKSKFDGLNETQDSIQTVSSWVGFYRRNAHMIVQVWEQSMREGTPHRQLVLVYLANDVCQQARARKREELVREFASVLPEALASASSKMPSNIMGKVRHVVDVWRQRNIFPADTLAQIDARLAQGSSGAAPPSRAIPRELAKLVDVSTSLNASVTAATGSVHTALATKYPQLFEVDGLPGPFEFNERLQDLLSCLAKARHDVQASVEKRRGLLQELKSLVQVHEAALASEEEQLKTIDEKTDTSRQTKAEIEQILYANGARPATPDSELRPPAIEPVDEQNIATATETRNGEKRSSEQHGKNNDDLLHDVSDLDPDIQALIAQGAADN